MKYKDFEPSIIQENKLLLLCKRLKSATLDDFTSFMEIDEKVINTILLYLIDEGCIKEENGVYYFLKSCAPRHNKAKRENKSLTLMFQFHSPAAIDLIIKSFCLGIQTAKTAYLTNLSNGCIADFYCEFRKLIYERQHKILLNNFFINPQIGRYRIFFEQYVYFYIYNNQVYLSNKYLNCLDGKEFTKPQIKEFKKIYCYLSRLSSHNTNSASLHNKIAEAIWRRNKSCNELYADLKCNLLNIS